MSQSIAGLMRRWIAVAIVIVIAAAAGLFTYRWHTARSAPAPEIALTDLDGQPHRLSEFRGKLTLVNFWASWCAPCLAELPELVKAQTDYGSRGLQIIGPAMDAPAAVRETTQRFKINYPVFVGDDEVMAAMEGLGDDLGALPFSVLVAPDGKVIDRLYGGLSAERLRKLLEKHLPS